MEDRGPRLPEAGGGQCDHFALGLLATAYDAGQIVPRDLKLTMAYSIAAARHRTLTADQLRERFGEELPHANFNAALQTGAQLARTNCSGH